MSFSVEANIAGEESDPRAKKDRLGNLDLLRTICAVFVIFEHFCETSIHNAFGFTYATSLPAHLVLRLIYGIARFAVPCFFLLSGYLSVHSEKQNVGKVIGLFAMTFLYSTIPLLASGMLSVLNGSFDSSFFLKTFAFLLLPKNYYLYLFSAVYILSPYLNRLVRGLTQRQYLRLLITLFVLFSVWSTAVNTVDGLTNSELTGAFFTSRTGTSMGFNVVNFAALYLTGGYVRLHYTPGLKWDRWITVFGILLSTVSTTVLVLLFPRFSTAAYFYDSVFITVGAICLFVLFTTFRISDNPVLRFMGKHTFGTYLIHGFASACIERILSIEKVVSQGLPGTLAGILIFVVGTYCLSLLITSVISFVFKPLNRRVKKTRLCTGSLFRDSSSERQESA